MLSSRIAKYPIELTGLNVKVSLDNGSVDISGKHGTLKHVLPKGIGLDISENDIKIILTSDAKDPKLNALAGTTRALLANNVKGVSELFFKKMQLVGVGYRAQLKDHCLSLTLGKSHPEEFKIPEGITIETPSQTEIIIKGIDKQLVGQVAANIRALRPPEPYKGKGIRYADERIIIKETKK